MAQRASDMFAVAAEEDGVVVSKNEFGIIVQYKNGEQRGVQLGRRYGHAEGSTYPHDILSTLKQGDKIIKGDIIAYNSGFYEPDMLNPRNVVFKTSMTVKTALYESSQTHEDSSSISSRLSEKLSTKTTKVRSIVLNFKQGVKNIVNPGQTLEPTDILCFIEDEITNELGIFDEDTLNTLKRVSNKAPKAKVKCHVDKIEVFYHGEKEDMSPSLKALVNKSDRILAETAKASGTKVFNGRVNDDYRVEGNPLGLDTAEIKIYLTLETKASVGDKGVFANQMKTVFSEVMEYEMTTESGESIDAVFGQQSIAARIVLSPELIGTTSTLLKLIGKKAVEIYKG